MKIVTQMQSDAAWHEAKRGFPSASSFGKIITADCKPSKSRMDYLYVLAGEIVTGRCRDTFQSKRMQEGIENEKRSIAVYEMAQGVDVERVGFCLHDSGFYGCSPDGLIGVDGGIETKDAAPHVQAKRLHHGWTGSEHHRQVHGCMLVTGRKWWDLVSHCDGMKQVRIRFERDDELMGKMHQELVIFAGDLGSVVKDIS